MVERSSEYRVLALPSILSPDEVLNILGKALYRISNWDLPEQWTDSLSAICGMEVDIA